MDSLEQELRRRLIAVREIHPSQAQIAENRLYEYQVKTGSVAMYYTFEVNHGI